MIGAAQLPCEAFVLAIVAEDVVDSGSLDGSAAPVFATQVLLVAEGFIVRSLSRVTRKEAHELGRDVAALCAGRTSEVSFTSSSGDLYFALKGGLAQQRGAVGVHGHVVQGDSGILSAFESRTDRSMLQSFGDDLRVFPYGG